MILLLGSTGYIGQAFAAELSKRNLDFTPLSRRDIDYSQFGTLLDFVRRTRPAFVINAAGMSRCPANSTESCRADMIHANVLLPQTVSRVCYLTNTPWGHVSCGNIFSGDAHANGYSETERPDGSFRHPHHSFYGGSKALGEEVLHSMEQTYIWRAAAVFDHMDHPNNALTLLRQRTPKTNAKGSLLHREDLASACLDLLRKNAPFGTYHLANEGSVDLNALVDRIPSGRLVSASQLTETAPFDAMSLGSPLEPVSLLGTAKLAELGIRLRPVQDAIAEALRNWTPSKIIPLESLNP